MVQSPGDSPTRGAKKRPWYWRVATGFVFAIAGWLVVTSALASRGTELRPSRNSDLIDLVRAEAKQNQQEVAENARIRAEVDQLASRKAGPDLTPELEAAAADAQMNPIVGPGIYVELADAPLSVQPAGVAPDTLVVHQQDIQAVMNAMWAGGAEAMSVQGKRISSRTGIKCVGNTVVVQGVPYAPPYRILAIGDAKRMQKALDQDLTLKTYRDYVRVYGLGYRVELKTRIWIPGYDGVTDVQSVRR